MNLVSYALAAALSISAAMAEDDCKTIVQLALDADPEFSTLVAAVTAADLVDTLSNDGPFTLFAPTNEAFEGLPEGAVEALLKPENKDRLRSLLLFHAVEGAVLSTDLVDGEDITTLNGEDVTVTIDDEDGSIMINDANVTTPNIEACNGVIHVIDKVLIPPIAKRCREIFSNVGAGTFIVALTAAGLRGDDLSRKGPYTIFPPSDEAFEALPEGTLTNLLKPENKDQLQNLLLRHVVDGAIPSTDLVKGRLETLSGEEVNVDLSEGVMINNAKVIVPDVESCRGGIIHVVDAVILPAEYKDKKGKGKANGIGYGIGKDPKACSSKKNKKRCKKDGCAWDPVTTACDSSDGSLSSLKEHVDGVNIQENSAVVIPAATQKIYAVMLVGLFGALYVV